MVPFEPGESPAVGAEARRRVKVAARLQDPLRPRAVERHLDQRVDGLARVGRVVLAHPDHPPASAVHHPVGIAQPARPAGLRGNRHRHGARLLPVQALVGVVAEIDRAVVGQVGAAAIFMDPAADIERPAAVGRHRRGHIGCRPVRGAAHEHRAPALLRPRFEPIDIGAVEQDLAEPDRRGNDHVGGDRRRP